VPDRNLLVTPNSQARYPGAMPHFLTQDPDHARIKQCVANYCTDVNTPDGVATLQIAIDTFKAAENLTPLLQSQLLK